MLTDEQIEKIIYPYTKRQAEFSLSVIRSIAKRLSNLADFDKLSTIRQTAVLTEEITYLKKLHRDYLKEQQKRLREDLWWIAVIIYMESLKFYEEQVELELNKALVKVINEIMAEAQKQLNQLLQHPVLVLRDLKNPAVLKAYDFDKAVKTIFAEATSYKNVPSELRDIALKRTETQLFDSGVRYTKNNSSDNAKDTISATMAIRMNVLDSVKNLINEMQDTMGDQFEADAVELSAHIFPAPDHAPAQGHQFSLEEVDKIQSGEDFEDLQGHQYVGFERNIGEWNCRHYFMKIKAGAKPQYSQKQLDKILEDNERGYTDENGKHYTLYECTQIQRRYEREIRKAKEKYLYGKSLYDRNMMNAAKDRVNALTTKYKQFSNQCNIPTNPVRIKVKDYS